MENFSAVERMVEDGGDDEGWVTHDTEGDEDDSNDNPAEMTFDSKVEEMNDEAAGGGDDDEDGEALDMEDFEESGMLDNVDPSVAIIKPVEKKESQDQTEDGVIHTRTYDLHIVYNKYYQTPHLFLIGYDKDENRKLLTVEQMFEDVSQDNAKKTVTIEQHPHLGEFFDKFFVKIFDNFRVFQLSFAISSKLL